jgi:protein-ribulosamine 3-kinase
LEAELKERLHTKRLDKLAASFAGACISRGHCYSIDDGSNIFVKTNSSQNARVMFDGEYESLKQINATKTIRAPKLFTVMHDYDTKGNSAIAMEFLSLSPLTDKFAKSLGKDLFKLHDYNNKLIRFNKRASGWVGKKIPSTKQVLEAKTKDKDDEDNEIQEEEDNQFSKHSIKLKPDIALQSSQTQASDQQSDYAERFVPEANTEERHEFGFDLPTSCGSIPQLNVWTQDWVSFYARCRLDHTIRMILSDHSDRELHEQWSHLQNKVDKYFSDFDYKGTRQGEIVPSLLHGDLWSGNAAQLSEDTETRAVIYDPASFYGHAEYEFGIVRMFGGLPKEFEIAYFEKAPKKKLFEKRNKLYQLFHHLNHWNHFGSGYRASSLRIMKDLNAEKF